MIFTSKRDFLQKIQQMIVFKFLSCYNSRRVKTVRGKSMVAKKENLKFRILYFIGIFFIVSGHIDGGSISLFTEWFPLYTFHLGLFVFASGYFFINNKEKSILSFLSKIIKKFLVPLYIWNFIYGIIITILHKLGFTFGAKLSFHSLFILPIFDGHQFVLNLSSWFIWPLFMLEAIHIFIIKILKCKKDYYFYFFYSVLIGFLGVELSILEYNKGLFLLFTRVMYFWPFFSLGMLYRIHLELKDNLNNYIYFSLIFLVSLISFYFFDGTITYTPSWGNDFDNFYRPFLVGFLGIAFWLRISQILVPILKDNKLVLFISRNTFSIMMHHLLGFFLLKCCFYILFKIHIISNFDVKSFKTIFFYKYLPKNISNFTILYVVMGFFIPIVILKIKNYIKNVQNGNKRKNKEINL